MKIFVVNAGSSSLKYQLIDMTDEKVIAKGLCECIGSKTEPGHIKHTAANGKVYDTNCPMPTHKEAFEAVMKAMIESEAKVIDSYDEISAIGHRIVQGGDVYKDSCLITEDVIATVTELSDLAPLHNPANVLAVNACIATFGKDVPQIAVFDTSFHQTMEPKAYMYGIPYEYYEDLKIRKYGFHGTSHKFVSDRAAVVEGKDKKDIKIITCHLGNGCSISAVKDGVCADTSMGLTPLDGFMMGTRSGGLDPTLLTFIGKKYSAKWIAEGKEPFAELDSILNKKSGVLGISGISNDNRSVSAAAKEGNERAKLAIDMQRYQIVKFIGSYVAAMNGVDTIVFTGGIGENDSTLRAEIMKHFGYLGIEIDAEKNAIRGEEIKISTDDSKVNVYVIPTNEELAIARDTKKIVETL